MGKKFFFAIIVLFGMTFAFGKSVSFQIVQHNNLNDVCETSLVMEDELLNCFFSRGYIVSNEPTIISSSKNQDEKNFQKGYNNAIDGYFDNFIQIGIEFNSEKSKNSKSIALGLIDKVTWKIVSLKTGKVIDENFKVVKKSMGADKEEDVRLFAKDLADSLISVLK